jgi:hypothetical protein
MKALGRTYDDCYPATSEAVTCLYSLDSIWKHPGLSFSQRPFAIGIPILPVLCDGIVLDCGLQDENTGLSEWEGGRERRQCDENKRAEMTRYRRQQPCMWSYQQL